MKSHVDTLLTRIQDLSQNGRRDFEEDEKGRIALLRAAQALANALKRPSDVCAEIAMSGMLYSAVRIAIDMELFEKVMAAEGPISSGELASQSGAEEQLILRLGRALTGTGFLSSETAKDGGIAYFANDITKHATRPNVRAGLKFHFDQGLPVAQKAPEYFKKHGLKIPKADSEAVFNYALQTEDECWTYWSKQPGVMENFNTFARGYFGTQTIPIRWFPYDEVCFGGFDPVKSGCEYLWVDVGGNKGHNLQTLVEKYPDVKGKFLLQDLPATIDELNRSDVRLSDKISTQGYDFFAAQPVKGAKNYQLENVCHNWDDENCRKILANVRDAMLPGYSKLIISSLTVPDENTPLELCGLDLSFMYLHSAGQRSERQWRDLLKSVGLRIVKIWPPPGIENAVIEVDRVG
ncbi:O-methyltransferase asqD [Pseudocercospora fuligena]|uniref:O-methyltransferase asqD n=1 Tax=Pseudocercospora fuligena TaxID=685502 RepID=A0A8H6RQ80_9PEZI|nr:O-methyltransferase asqD [Pseudocercospora fuligena]